MNHEKITETYDVLKTFIPKDDIYLNEPMSKHTTFKIGGNADIFVKLKSVEQIEKTIETTRKIGVPLKFIGNGSNILVKDEGIRGVVAKICTSTYDFIDETTLRLDSGLLNAKVARILLDHSLAGFEFASGIPGTLGGAVKMNAGAYGSEMKNIVVSTRYIDLDSDKIEIKEINNAEHEFSYRHSIFSNKNAIIIDTTLRLQTGNKGEIEEKLCNNLDNRRAKQPIDKPSAGSTFKRPEGYFAGKLIQDAGLRGFQVGGAQVSEKHCGFVINKDQATASDVMNLMNQVSDKVYEMSGVRLEPEVKRLGEF